MELGPVGIRANVICPGSISGERMDRVIAAESRTGGVPEEKLRDIYTRGCSMKTFIDGEDIADMAVFLASDGARKVTGQVLNVDGHLESLGGLNE
jgi:NAD(P)-dependent dehydrogenase (short-subunit alcohol dehydrogenase family)